MFSVAISLALALAQIVLLSATPIDNGVKGYPHVTCGPHSVVVDVDTEKPFEGRLFVKGDAHSRECLKAFGHAGAPLPVAPIAGPAGEFPLNAAIPPAPVPGVPALKPGYPERVGFEIGFGQCHMRRQRTLVPRGVEYTFTLVTSFHPFFITKVDRAYRIRCFYMEAEKILTNALEVSMLPTAQINQQFPMPTCQYHIKKGALDGPYARFARVGEPIYHIWSCDKVAGWVYGILVKNCYVDDGQGSKFQLINEHGCAIDRHLVGDLTYDNLLISASVESHVFKYADKPSLYFTCTIEICFKADGGCAGRTPPRCGGPALVAPVIHPIAPEIHLAEYGVEPHLSPEIPVPGPYRQDTPVEETDNIKIGRQFSTATPHVNVTLGLHRLKRAGESATVSPTKIHRRIAFEADLVANPIVVLPFEDRVDLDNESNVSDSHYYQQLSLIDRSNKSGFCLSPAGFGLILALFLTLFLGSTLATAVLIRKYLRGKSVPTSY